jgi:hypothetical protein
MPTATINNRVTVEGRTYTRATTVAADGITLKEKTALAAAKIGSLTTRTDNDTGTLTMAASHGITTGARLDIYWEEGGVKGHRRGVTVGTVATNSVPIDGGAGDNLPTNLTAVTACVPSEEEFLVTGNNAQFIAAKSSRRGIIVFADVSDVEKHYVATELEASTGGGYQWFTGNGVTNPLSGDTVTKVFFSNGDSAGTNAMAVSVGVN